MAAHGLTDEILKQTVAAFEQHGGNEVRASMALGLSRGTFQHRLRMARMRQSATGEIGGPPIPEIAKPPEGFVVTRNSGAYDAHGNLLRQFVQTRRDAGEPYEVPEGHAIKGESALLDPSGRVLAKWVKTREDGSGDMTEALSAALERYSGKAPPIAKPKAADSDLITVYPIPDLHLGMYAWGPEAGEDYDVDLAVAAAREAVGNLIAQSRPSRHAVLLGLGDYFHQNGGKAATPGSGHQIDVDGRWMKVKMAGAELALALAEMIARKHQEVEVVFLPGNHDPDAALGLTVALSLFFRGHKRISVNTSPAIAWYRRFGATLLGATHGHTMKPDRMALMLAADRAEDWGKAKHRHFFFGHVHHESAREVGAVRVESFATPAAKDAYAAAGGWRSSRAFTAITFHARHGEIGRHRVHVHGGRADEGKRVGGGTGLRGGRGKSGGGDHVPVGVGDSGGDDLPHASPKRGVAARNGGHAGRGAGAGSTG